MSLRQYTLQSVVSWLGIVLVTVFFLSLSLLAGWWLGESSQRDLEARARSLAAVMATQAVEPILLDDAFSTYQVLARGIHADDELIYAFIIRDDHRVLAHTFQDGFPLDLLKLALKSDTPMLTLRTGQGYILDVSVPILDGTLGHLHLGVSEKRIVAQQRRFNMILLGLLLPMLIVTLMMARLIGQQIGLPLARLTASARQVARGGIGPDDIPVNGAAEVRDLSLAFRDMLRDLRRLEAEQKSAQMRMVAAERLAATGELAAGLAHEILNPLDGVMECCRQLEPHVAGTERPAKYLRLTREGLIRIERVMRQLLVFARPRTAPPELSPCPLDSLVGDTLELIGPRFAHRGITLEPPPPSGLVCLCAKALVEQAVLNLLLNAADACGEQPQPLIRLHFEARTDTVLIHIEDNGPGVPPEQHELIFQLFFSSKDPGKGTGLGLTTSRTLIEQCGGELTLAPTLASIGGAHFIISLTRHLAAAPAGSPPPSPTAS